MMAGDVKRSWIQSYSDAISKLSDAAQSEMMAAIEKIDFTDIAAARDAVISVFERYMPSYMEASATVAAEFYDMVRAQSVGKPIGAVLDYRYSQAADSEAVRALIESVVDSGTTDVFFEKLRGRIDSEMKRAAYDTTIYNVRKDPAKPRFARVPMATASYANGCPFCQMLAGRGAAYYSKESAGEGDHWHAGCACKVVPIFKGAQVEGYDPKFYQRAWLDSMERDGKTESDYASKGTQSRDANRAQTQQWQRERYRMKRLGL